jgi:hypothetical protein
LEIFACPLGQVHATLLVSLTLQASLVVLERPLLEGAREVLGVIKVQGRVERVVGLSRGEALVVGEQLDVYLLCEVFHVSGILLVIVIFVCA